MKERIVIKDEIFADFLIKNKENHSISASPKVIMDRCRVEQIPENFEELKELCKKYNGKGLFIANSYIEVGGVLVYSNMVFTNDGAIYVNTDCMFVEKISIPQMWQIIKGLRGE